MRVDASVSKPRAPGVGLSASKTRAPGVELLAPRPALSARLAAATAMAAETSRAVAAAYEGCLGWSYIAGPGHDTRLVLRDTAEGLRKATSCNAEVTRLAMGWTVVAVREVR